MSVVYILLGIVTAIILGYGVKTLWRADELDEREEELNKYSVHLDELANKLALDEYNIRQIYKQLREELKKNNETRND